MATPTGLDLDALLGRIHGNRAALERLGNVMIEHLPQRVGALRTALEAGDTDALSRAAHTLKGSLSAFTVGVAWQGCSDLERAAHAGDVQAMRAGVAQISDQVDDLMAELRAHAAGEAHVDADPDDAASGRP